MSHILENVLGVEILDQSVPIRLMPINASKFQPGTMNLEVVLAESQEFQIVPFLQELRESGAKINFVLYMDGVQKNAVFKCRPVTPAIKSYLIKNRILGYPFCQLFYRNRCVVSGDPTDKVVQAALLRNNAEYQNCCSGPQLGSTFLTEADLQ